MPLRQLCSRRPSDGLLRVHLKKSDALLFEFGQDVLLCRPGLVCRLATEGVELGRGAHRSHEAAQLLDGHVLLPRVAIYRAGHVLFFGAPFGRPQAAL